MNAHDVTSPPGELWLLLPAFNEAANLGPLLTAVADVLSAAGLFGRVIVVDDGSSDGTETAARTFRGRLPLEVVVHPRNLGLARSVESALRVSLGQADGSDAIVTMDADNTHPAEMIPGMVEAIRRGADVVIASRYAAGGGEEGVPLLRRLLSHGIGLLLRLRYRLPGVRDYSSGYRAYRAGLLQAALGRYGDRLIESAGFTVMAELLLKLRPFRPRITELPLRLRYDRKRGGSKMQLGRTVIAYVGLLLKSPLGQGDRDGRNRGVGGE